MMSQPAVYARFAGGLRSRWRQSTRGTGGIRMGGGGLRLENDAASAHGYTNAQIDDYQGLARADFPWRPPLRFSARARFSHDSGKLTGTAGFGFWNDPFRMSGLRPPALPQALWFFYAGPDADIRLTPDQPGWGWKASVVDAAAGWMAACFRKHPMRRPVRLGWRSGWTISTCRSRLGGTSAGERWRKKRLNGWRSTGWRSNEERRRQERRCAAGEPSGGGRTQPDPASIQTLPLKSRRRWRSRCGTPLQSAG